MLFIYYQLNEFESPSTGINLYGSSLSGAINLESTLINWHISLSQILTNNIDTNASLNDIIWLHPSLSLCTTNCNIICI